MQYERECKSEPLNGEEEQQGRMSKPSLLDAKQSKTPHILPLHLFSSRFRCRVSAQPRWRWVGTWPIVKVWICPGAYVWAYVGILYTCVKGGGDMKEKGCYVWLWKWWAQPRYPSLPFRHELPYRHTKGQLPYLFFFFLLFLCALHKLWCHLCCKKGSWRHLSKAYPSLTSALSFTDCC